MATGSVLDRCSRLADAESTSGGTGGLHSPKRKVMEATEVNNCSSQCQPKPRDAGVAHG